MIFEKIKISEISLVVRGSSPRPQGDPRFFGGNIPRLTIRDVTRDGKYVTPILDSLTELGAKQGRVMPKGTLTVSASGTVCVPSFLNVSSSVHDGFFAFKKIFDNYDINFLYYQILLLKKDIKKHINDGGVFKNLNTEIFNNLEVYYTDIKKQIKIVEIIDKQQELIDSYKEKLSLLEKQESYYQEELLSGRIRIKLNPESEQIATNKGFIFEGDLVSGKEKEFEEWLSVNFKDKVEFYSTDDFISINLNNRSYEIPKDWKIEKISDVFYVSRGKVLSKEYIDKNKGIYPVYSSATENHGVIGYIKTYMYDGEYLTWTTDGIYAGKIFYRNGKFSATNVCGVLKLKKEGYNYNIIKFFTQYFFNINVNKVGNNKLMSNTVSNINFILPKLFTEQYLINSIFNNIEKNKNLILEKIKIEEEKMEYLLENLLTGKIQVE